MLEKLNKILSPSANPGQTSFVKVPLKGITKTVPNVGSEGLNTIGLSILPLKTFSFITYETGATFGNKCILSYAYERFMFEPNIKFSEPPSAT